ncbi:MAG: catabolite control protein A [Ruminococcaceae bacterium]|nr:catabolite control protein A [Oscillospiraceae bacterium]
MKRLLPLVLALLVVVLMTACGTPANNSTITDVDASTITESNAGNTIPTNVGTFNKTAQIAETVLVDENNVKITATGLTYDDYNAEVELLIENNSDKDLSFVCGSSGYNCNSINGYMTPDGYLFCDVTAGKKAYDSVSFSYDELMLYGINEIADIELGFCIENDDYNRTYTGPQQIKTSIANSFDYDKEYFQDAITDPSVQKAFYYSTEFFSADTLYDQNGISVRSEALVENGHGELMLLLEIMNASSEMVYVVTDDIAINGLVCRTSPWSSDMVTPGKKSVAVIQLHSVLSKSYWDDLGIKDITSIDLTINIEDQEGTALADPAALSVKISDSNQFDSSGAEVYNANGIRVISKGVFESDSDYDDDLYPILLVENNSGKTIRVYDVYDSLSINGFMMDYYLTSVEIDDGKCAVVEIDLYDSSLKKNKITSISDIAELELKLSFLSGNKTIDEPKVIITY